MNESLLHFIWKFRLFDANTLQTTEGESVEIVYPGFHNTDSGPDFENAKVRIGQTLWVGNVELHIHSSDWEHHQHGDNSAYDNVILHVVYEDDRDTAMRPNGERIPLVVLNKRIYSPTLYRYEQLAERKKGIPCEQFFLEIERQTLSPFLARLLVERLEEKVKYIYQILNECKGDWENTAFQIIARYFGASVNKEPFEQLAKSLPVKIWAKYTSDPLQVEALLFGQAGFLSGEVEEEYPKQLKKEYLYLKRLHALSPLPKHIWKLLRLRPSNFPTLRIAQLSSLLIKETNIFSVLLETKDIKAFHRFFDVEVSAYWKSHYVFDKKAKQVRSHIGPTMKNILLINAVAPLLFAYGKYKGEESYCDWALQLLESCPPEKNALMEYWISLGVAPANSFDTQALLQLRTGYCNQFRCLSCAVGLQILK